MRTNKLFVIMLMGIFMISFASAWSFDNVKHYDATKRIVTVNNCDLWLGVPNVIGTCLNKGEFLVEAKLISPDNKKVLAGIDTLVGEFNITVNGNFLDAFGDLELKNLKNGKQITRGGQYKYKAYKEESIDDYGYECEDVETANGTIQDCEYVEVGKHTEISWEWKPILNSKEIFKSGKDYDIGVFVDTVNGDRGDWIPSFVGKAIPEWASWTTENCGTGGSLAIIGDDCIHTFASSGTFGYVDKISDVEVLVVAGGGVGGWARGGGGGAGGLIHNTSYSVSANVSVTVGVGGTGATSNSYGGYGTDSVFGTLTGVRGGQGGSSDGAYSSGTNGGSGGGSPNSADTSGTGTSGQGYDGGVGKDSPWIAGGGGGAGGIGQGGLSGGAGGIGYTTNINGTSFCYAGGGGGATNGATAGTGSCGGSDGATYGPASSSSATGFGAGSGGSAYATTGDASDGIVIVKYEAFLLNDLAVTQNSPVDTYNTTSRDVVFNCSATDGIGVINLTLNIDGVANHTITDGGAGDINLSLQTTVSLPDGSHNWSCTATDDTESVNSGNLTLTIDTTPHIQYEDPTQVDDYNSSSPYIPINVSLTETYFDTIGFNIGGTEYNYSDGTRFINNSFADGTYEYFVTVYTSTGQNNVTESRNITIDTTPSIVFVTPPTLINYANITQEYIPMKVITTTAYFKNITYYLQNVNGTFYTDYYETPTYDINFTDMPDAHYHYNVTICTTTDQCNTTETRHLNHDATAPVLSDPYNLTDLTTKTLPINSTWHFNATDINIDKCWYMASHESGSFWVEDPIVIVTCNSTITDVEWTFEGNKSIDYCANDTFGLETCGKKYLWIYELTDTQTESNDPTVEGLTETWTLQVNRTAISTTTAYLVVDGSVYDPTTTTAGTDGYTFEVEKEIPQTWGNTTGNLLDWYWNYTIEGIVANQSTDTENITVYELAIDDCTTYGDLILNMSLLNEEDGVAINETAGSNFELDLTLTSKANSSITLDYSNIWTDDNNPLVCIPSEVLNNTEWQMDFTIGFDSTDHVWEFYYLDNGTLDSTKIFNSLTKTPLNFYDLLTADSTSFLFKYYDADGLNVDDSIVHVFRKYVGEGTFLEVERAKSDNNGDTIVHLVEEDVIYYFVISQYGQILFTSSQYTALCQATPCTIQIEASGGSATFPTEWDLVEGGAYTISSSSTTRDVTLNYSVDDPKTVNLTVYKYESDGSYTALDTGSSTGLTGSVVLNVPQSAGNVSFFASVIMEEEFVDSEWIDFSGKSSDKFGVALSLFIASLIILTLGLMSVSEGGITIFWVVLGVALSGFLGLINTEVGSGVSKYSIVIFLIVAGALLLWKLTGGRK